MKFRLITLMLIAVSITFFLGTKTAYPEMQPGCFTKARKASSTTIECMQRYRDILHDEIKNPTERRKGFGGGDIYHDYQMQQITTAYINLLMRPKGGKLSPPKKQNIDYLKTMLDEEKLQEAREVFQIVLVNAGETSYSENLIPLLKEDGRHNVRVMCIDAVWHAKDLALMPELIYCLSDSNTAVKKDYSKGGLKKYFPVRSASNFALRKFGVSVEKMGDDDYKVDKRSAIAVIKERMKTASPAEKVRLSKAITRIEYSISKPSKDKAEDEAIKAREEAIGSFRETLERIESLEEWPNGINALRTIVHGQQKDESKESVKVRLGIVGAVREVALEPETGITKRRALVELLTELLNDSTPIIRSTAKRFLLSFTTSDYTEEAKATIRAKLKENPNKNMILIAGIADMEYCLKQTQHMLTPKKKLKEDLEEEAIWGEKEIQGQELAAMLVLSRSGDKEGTRRLLSEVEQRSRKVTLWTRRFDDLAYTLQPEAADYLVAKLATDDDIPGDPDTWPTSCARRACQALSKMLEGFPAPSTGTIYSDKDIAVCRKWAEEQTKWHFKLHLSQFSSQKTKSSVDNVQQPPAGDLHKPLPEN